MKAAVPPMSTSTVSTVVTVPQSCPSIRMEEPTRAMSIEAVVELTVSTCVAVSRLHVVAATAGRAPNTGVIRSATAAVATNTTSRCTRAPWRPGTPCIQSVMVRAGQARRGRPNEPLRPVPILAPVGRRIRFRPPGLKPTTKVGTLGPYRGRLGLGWVIAPMVVGALLLLAVGVFYLLGR